MSEEETQVVFRVPLWISVPIVVLISLVASSLTLGLYALALWSSFIAWAEYFALGAKPDALKPIWLLFPLGALTMALFALFNHIFVLNFGWNPWVSVAVWLFIWVLIAVYIMKFHPIFQYSLPYFNGLSMFLALYFGIYTAGGFSCPVGVGCGPVTGNPYIDPWILWIWISLSGIFGGFLGWLNIQLSFPKVVKVTKP